MRLLSWIITLPLLLICVLFAVSNRQTVTIDLWPLDYVLTAPLYILTLGGFFLGLLLGAFLLWAANLHHRWARRRLQKEVATLKDQLIEERARRAALPPVTEAVPMEASTSASLPLVLP